jgi:signal transduction histidine kinase
MHELADIRARLRRLDPRVGDALLAIAFFVAMIPPALRHTHGWGAERLVTLAGAALLALAIYWRRSPRAIPILVVAVPVVIGLDRLAGGGLDVLDPPFFAVLVLLYSLGAHQSGRTILVAGTLAGVAYLVTNLLLPTGASAADVIWLIAFTVAPILLGRAVRDRREITATVAARALLLEHERIERAARVTADERARIAEELHDVVAHSVSEMTIQAAAARRVLARDADAAKAALLAAEETGRAALTEMRHLLGVLRSDGDVTLTPQPSMRRLTVLSEEFGRRGLTVSVTESGADSGLSSGLDLTAYRILEDLLLSAVALGARTATVEVRYAPSVLELRVHDDRRRDARQAPEMDDDGTAIGVRERAELYGGRVQTGHRPDGTFGARVVLPTRTAVTA